MKNDPHTCQMTKTFKPGQVVVWDAKFFNPKYWDGLSEEDRVKYYGALGYGRSKPKLFVFLTEIANKDGDTGHCVLVSLEDQKIETMRHTNEFRLATDEEF
jgi:hypothetical protein